MPIVTFRKFDTKLLNRNDSNRYDCPAILILGPQHFDKIRLVQDCVEKMGIQHGVWIHASDDIERVVKTQKTHMNRLREAGIQNPHWKFENQRFVVLDYNVDWRDRDANNLLFNGRFHGLIVFLISHRSPTYLPPNVRVNTGFVFICKGFNHWRKLWKYYGEITDEFTFVELYNGMMDTADFLVIDNRIVSRNLNDNFFFFYTPSDSLVTLQEIE